MQEHRFKRWRICVDTDATREAYESIHVGSPERCGCAPCRNFAAARGHVYPPAVLDLLQRLGIAFDREAEIYHLGRLSPGLHQYGGWFHFIGQIESVGDDGTQAGKNAFTGDLEVINESFSIGLTARAALIADSFKNRPIVQVEFLANVPWVLDDEEVA